MLPHTMVGLVRSCLLAGVLLLSRLATAQERERVQTDAGTIAFDNQGTCWLSFVVVRPKGKEVGVKLKVARPEAGSPEPGLPKAVIAPQGRGSWIWIGEGHERGMAALFTLDADGHVAWISLTPRIALEYLPPAGRGENPRPSARATRRRI